jgi:hypothetical protein
MAGHGQFLFQQLDDLPGDAGHCPAISENAPEKRMASALLWIILRMQMLTVVTLV